MIDKGLNKFGWPVGLTREEAAAFSAEIKEELNNWLLNVRHYPAEGDTVRAAMKILDDYSRPEKH